MDIDFPLVLVILVFGSGLIWLLDHLLLAPGRRLAVTQLQRDYPNIRLVQGDIASPPADATMPVARRML